MSFDITRQVVEHSRTRGPARAILLALAFRADKSGRAWPSLFTLAQDSGLTRRTVCRTLPAIEALGELRIARRRVRGGRAHLSSVYQLVPRAPDPRDPRSPPTKAPRDRQSLGVGTDSPRARDRQSPRTVMERSFEPSTASGRGFDYARAELPKVEDYHDLHAIQDPILAAVAVTGDRAPKAWKFWVRVLNAARRKLGQAAADAKFMSCVSTTWGEDQAGECQKPGACLNLKLKKAFPEVVT